MVQVENSFAQTGEMMSSLLTRVTDAVLVAATRTSHPVQVCELVGGFAAPLTIEVLLKKT